MQRGVRLRFGELEPGYSGAMAALGAMGHDVLPVRAVGGGMNAIGFAADSTLTGAACWRADGTTRCRCSRGCHRPRRWSPRG